MHVILDTENLIFHPENPSYLFHNRQLTAGGVKMLSNPKASGVGGALKGAGKHQKLHLAGSLFTASTLPPPPEPLQQPQGGDVLAPKSTDTTGRDLLDAQKAALSHTSDTLETPIVHVKSEYSSEPRHSKADRENTERIHTMVLKQKGAGGRRRRNAGGDGGVSRVSKHKNESLVGKRVSSSAIKRVRMDALGFY